MDLILEKAQGVLGGGGVGWGRSEGSEVLQREKWRQRSPLFLCYATGHKLLSSHAHAHTDRCTLAQTPEHTYTEYIIMTSSLM